MIILLSSTASEKPYKVHHKCTMYDVSTMIRYNTVNIIYTAYNTMNTQRDQLYETRVQKRDRYLERLDCKIFAAKTNARFAHSQSPYNILIFVNTWHRDQGRLTSCEGARVTASAWLRSTRKGPCIKGREVEFGVLVQRKGRKGFGGSIG